MGKKEMLSVIDENNEEKIVKLIAYFTLINNENDYIAYTEYDNDLDNVKVYVGRVELSNNKIILRTIESDEEIDNIKEVLVSLSNTPEEGFNYVLNNIDIILKTNYKIIKDIKNIFVLKEVFVNNIIDNYEYILNKQEQVYECLEKSDLFIELEYKEENNFDEHNIGFNGLNEFMNTNKQVEEENNLHIQINNLNNELNDLQYQSDINNQNNDKDIQIDNLDNGLNNFMNESNTNNDDEFMINNVEVEDIKLPSIEDFYIHNNETFSIDKQIKVDMNKEKIKYLNILKTQIDQEIEKLENENQEIYNN